MKKLIKFFFVIILVFSKNSYLAEVKEDTISFKLFIFQFNDANNYDAFKKLLENELKDIGNIKATSDILKNMLIIEFNKLQSREQINSLLLTYNIRCVKIATLKGSLRVKSIKDKIFAI